MGVYQKLPDDITEVDVIVAGGGTSGCIVAARLAAADPKLSVLVVEGGKNSYQDPSIVHVGFFFGHLMPGAPCTNFYQSTPSEHLNGRATVVPGGCVLGGGSSINMAMYTRPQRSDYDAWDTPGWTADDMLPFMQKFETYHGKGSRDVHGYDGPVHISKGTWEGGNSEDNFMAATKKAGFSEVDDAQDTATVNAFARSNRFVSLEGQRQDASHTYLHPLLQDGKHSNLHVVVESTVSRVIVENQRATGVIFAPSAKFHPNDATERTVRARKMVVVSGGAFGSPTLLERSGIGSSEILSKAGVPLVAENLGVGVGYDDHDMMVSSYKTSLGPEDTLDGMIFGSVTPEIMMKEKAHWLGYNGQGGHGKVRPTDEEAAAMGPEFEKAWNVEFKNKPDKPLVAMAQTNAIPGNPGEGVPPGQYMGLTVFDLYPFSRGHIHITGPSVDAPIDFDTGFLSDPQGLDLKKHIWAYKKQREIMRRMDCFRGEVPTWHPPFAADSPAAVVETDGPLPENVEDIKYSAEDDKVIEQFIRDKATTTWHSMGTCKMKPKEKGGAVDGELNVYGVDGLKVADMSIVPNNVGCNTNSVALTIGERAADIFLRELGLAN